MCMYSIYFVNYFHEKIFFVCFSRQMWAVFEWENKVAVNTQLTNLHDYLEHLLKSTNMKSLTPDKGNNYD